MGNIPLVISDPFLPPGADIQPLIIPVDHRIKAVIGKIIPMVLDQQRALPETGGAEVVFFGAAKKPGQQCFPIGRNS